MTEPDDRITGEFVLWWLVRLMPADFRDRRGRDVVECHRDLWREEIAGRRWWRRWAYWVGAVASTVGVLVVQWLRGTLVRSDGEGTMKGEGWIRDVRHGLRRLGRRPRYAAAAVLTLALGLGANTAVFSVLHTVLLAPLPYEESERLIRIYGNRVDRPGEFERLYLSTPAAHELRDQVPSFESVAVLENQSPTGMDLTGGERPERVRLLRVNAEYFRTLRATPVAGRVFERSEEVADSRVAIVSERLWQAYLGGRRDALGSSLTLDGEAHTVVGAMSDDLRDPIEGRIDVWMPLDLETNRDFWGNNWLTAYGRLGPGATPASLRAELDVVQGRHADMTAEAAEKGFVDIPLHRDLVGDSRPLLFAVMGAVLFLLLLTAVNVASLMLAEAATRSRDFAIRTSLGSSRASLVRQFVAEALLLSLAGAAAGLLVGIWTLDLIVAVAPADLPRADGLRLGSVAVLFAAGGALLLGTGLGLATALPFSRADLSNVASGSRGGGDQGGRAGLRSALVRVEVALAVLLLSGAGVLARSIHELQTRDVGVDPEPVLTFEVGLPDVRYGDDAAIYAFSERLHERLEAIPRVELAAVTSRLPVTGSFNTWGTRRAHGPDDPWETDNISVNQRWIAGDYFQAVGLDVVAGRDLDATDEAGAPYATVINATLAARLFGSDEPLGSWLRIGGRFMHIVGVVEDEALNARSPAEPIAYHHQRQWISGSRKMTQVVRVAGDPLALLPDVRAALAEVDPDLVLVGPAPLDEVIGHGIARERFAAILLLGFAGLAVTVAGLGLYGVLAHLVGRRRHEIGVRMALGADRRGVVGMVFGRGMTLALTGAAVGVVLALALGSALDFLVFGVSSRDPLAVGASPLILMVVAAAASWLPALRATRVDPATSFRAE